MISSPKLVFSSFPLVLGMILGMMCPKVLALGMISPERASFGDDFSLVLGMSFPISLLVIIG